MFTISFYLSHRTGFRHNESTTLFFIGLVYVALWLGRRFYKGDPSTPQRETVAIGD